MASLGPLESFVFPGVYTQTRVQAPTTAGGGQLRYPAIIGVGQETDSVTFEMVRGSSATASNIIAGEDLGKTNVIDGVNVVFNTAVKPIVRKNAWEYASQPSDVIVTVNSEQVPVQSVDGVNGIVTLMDAPAEGTLVEIAYYFKRTDTYVESEDLSIQVDGVVKSFMVRTSRIVDGTNGGTTLTGKGTGTVVILLDNGNRRTVPVFKVTDGLGNLLAINSISGASRSFELVNVPTLGSEVIVSYFTNDYQNTYDILPAALVQSIDAVGNSPDEQLWLADKDYVLAGSNQIHWNNSVLVESGVATGGTTLFGATQVKSELIDNRVYNARVLSSTVAPLSTITLPSVPVRGDGTGKPMTDALGNTVATFDDLKVYAGWQGTTGSAGTYVGPAGATGVAQIAVSTVEGQTVKLASAIPAGSTVWATYYTNSLADRTWTVTDTLSGIVGSGEYTVASTVEKPNATVYQTLWSGGTLVPGTPSTGIFFLDQAEKTYDGDANGAINVFVPPTYNSTRAEETITVTVAAIDVDGNQFFTVTSDLVTGTGSGYTNVGAVGTTYVDPVTGFTISIASSAAGTIEFTVSNNFVNQGVAVMELGIPGIQFTVGDTTGVAASDTANIRTINLQDGASSEPLVGDTYFVKFTKVRTDYSIKYVANLQEAIAIYGAVNTSNPLMIAASVAFQNGAPALAIKQLQKNSGGVDANVVDYIAAIDLFDEPLPNGTRPSLMQPMSTHATVVAYLKTSNSKQSSIRYRNERTSFVGFGLGTVMETVINTCKGLATEFVTAIYPDSAKITVPNSVDGADTQIVVGGAYMAVAMAGLDTNPAYDVATPLTNKTLTGFDSIGRIVKTTDAQLIASSGCTMVAQQGPGVLKILMSLTTDLSGPLTRDPRIIEIKHDIQKGSRLATDPYIGFKGLPSVPKQVETAMTNFLQAKKNAQIIYAYQGVRAVYDSADPTVINVEAYYRPIFGVNWIIITFNITTSMG